MQTPSTCIALTCAALLTAGTPLDVKADSFAIFSVQGQNSIRTLDTRTGQPVTGTLASGQTLSAAQRTGDQLLYSVDGTWATHIVNPEPLEGPSANIYASNRSLGVTDAGATGDAVGTLYNNTLGSPHALYHLAATGPTAITTTNIHSVAVSKGTALVGRDNGQIHSYDLATGTFSGNLITGSMTVAAGAGDSGTFAFGFTAANNTSHSRVATSPPLALVSGASTASLMLNAFGSQDVLLATVGSNIVRFDSRSSTAFVTTASGQALSHAVALGNSNLFILGTATGGTHRYDVDAGTYTTFSSVERLVSGFSFGDYALLGLLHTDGSGRTVLVDHNGSILSTVASSTGDASAAYVIGAGTSYTVIPEPGSMTLLGLGGVLILFRRRA
ncbi:PEP-CTERM sorting domain-containing protein [Phycisphaerales bacterium AB-hyl4]|uniref:PEP-CTERM sorting domain-containing protein n=1 Tax=Natronomicrosphaera hydrolytica TaxID=3242702 RepID=A0ABV4UC07_9BACT